MKVLCIGDIVGKTGREAVMTHVPVMKASGGIDFVIANAENAAAGHGVTEKIAKELFQAGCDVLTLGDHIWDKKDLYPYLKITPHILRPLNFPVEAPGRGYCIIDLKDNVQIAVVCLLGRVFIKYHTDCPFRAIDTLLKNELKQVSNIIVEMHAEATSEKVTMGHFLNGKVSAVFGTHTHVQTADETILSQQTAYITDIGMTGPRDSVIGQKKELIIERYWSGLPQKFEVSSNPAILSGIVLDIDETTGKAKTIQRVNLSSQA